MGLNLLWLICGLGIGGIGGALWQRRSQPPSQQDRTAPDRADQNSAAPDWANTAPATGSPSATTPESPLLWRYYQALELSQFKGGFLARTAHELRSPLSSLMGLHQLILTDLCDSPEEERECVAQAYEAAQKFYGLLETLISVSKLETGGRSLDTQPIVLDLLVEDVHQAVRLPLGDRNIHLTIDWSAEADSPPSSLQPGAGTPKAETIKAETIKAEIIKAETIKADYGCLRQIMIQLLLMAAQLKATEIRWQFRYSPDGQFLGFLLSDNRAAGAWQETLEDWQTLQQNLAPSSPDQDLLRHWQPAQLSPGLSLLVQQSLLAQMGGQLELLSVPPTPVPPSEISPSTPPQNWSPLHEPLQNQLCCWLWRV